jgi:hypothetical protein
MAGSVGAQDEATDAAVLAAFIAARGEGRSSVDCYKAGVEVERSLHPEYHPAYAARLAVRAIFKTAFEHRVAPTFDERNS